MTKAARDTALPRDSRRIGGTDNDPALFVIDPLPPKDETPMRSPSLPSIACRPISRLGMLAIGLHIALCSSFLLGSERRITPIVKAVQQAKGSIVNIHGHKTVAAVSSVGDSPRQVNGMGTGVVIDPRGYIVTNHHVVEGVRRIQVTLASGETHIARLIAHDRNTDLAVIKIDAKSSLPIIPLGTSEDLMPGETVIAVGNAYGYENSVTRGIISALHRNVQVTDTQRYDDLIQTDASINPGNSGGPLLNIDGEMIGINVAVRVGAQGIGFAIPVNKFLAVTARLMSVERLADKHHGLTGVTKFENERPVFTITGVEPGSPADAAKLKIGDHLAKIGEYEIRNQLDVELALLERSLGEEVRLTVQREGEGDTDLAIVVRSLSGSSEVSDLAWSSLGVRVKPMPASEFRKLNSRYQGGLVVVAVRANSPADEQGISAGDILVGMHDWETVSFENLDYVLKSKIWSQQQMVRFYILRDKETLFGNISVADTRQVTQR